MRHKYHTHGLVLSRVGVGETGALIMVLTEEFGLVRTRAQGIRRSGAKLAGALTTLTESDFMFVRGREGWRLTGAVLDTAWFGKLPDALTRERAGRITSLVLRLVTGETPDRVLYPTVLAYLRALTRLPQEAHDAAEILAALYVLAALGLDDLSVANPEELFSSEAITRAQKERTAYVARVNRGLEASGL